MAARSRVMSIAVALICAVSVIAAQSGGSKDEQKSDGAVTGAAKATAKTTADASKATAKKTAGGAKKLGLGIKDAVTPDSDKDKDKNKK